MGLQSTYFESYRRVCKENKRREEEIKGGAHKKKERRNPL